MFNIHPLYSSSSGNMFHVENDNTSILIDAGVSFKQIKEGLASINKTIENISGILLTHEHSDHIKGLPMLCKKANIKIYACGETADFITQYLKEKNVEADIVKIMYGQVFYINDLEIHPFETSHDAIMPCGYKIKSNTSILTYATDLGFVSDEVYDNFKSSDFIVLESNYDESMLEFGKYPYSTKRRIKSNIGHLSNENCANTISSLYKHNVSNFILAHLSENNNETKLAKHTIDCILKENNIDPDSININFASKYLSSEVYSI